VPILYLVYLYEAQVYRDEPLNVLGLTVGGGLVIGVVLSVVADKIIQGNGKGDSVGQALVFTVILPIVQIVLMTIAPLLLRGRPQFAQTIDGLVFGVAPGLGFSVGEGLVRFSSVFTNEGLHTGSANWLLPLLSVAVLVGATAALIPVSDVLTGSVAQVTHLLGWTEVFVGIVIVANAGNVAEAYAALRLAWQRGGRDPQKEDSGLDLSLGIASASSIQIATFIAPVIVLYSLTGHVMNLVFSPVEIAILSLLVVMSTFIAQDGESNWLEGVQLVVLYGMAAVVFYSFSASVFGG